MLGYLKSQRVGAYNWVFAAGKTPTIYPSASWEKPCTAYDPKEVDHLRSVTGKQ